MTQTRFITWYLKEKVEWRRSNFERIDSSRRSDLCACGNELLMLEFSVQLRLLKCMREPLPPNRSVGSIVLKVFEQ
jgi:chemotaxis methyl-accepting protein methylase